MSGFGGGIISVDISKDCKYIAIGTSEGELSVLNAEGYVANQVIKDE